MRSLFNAAKHFVARVHILASAYPLDDGTPLYVGQRPSWFNYSTSERFRIHHDADYFSPVAPLDADAFRRRTLPTFNSLAVESQLHNLPDSSSDHIIYMNDDFFHLRPHASSDYASSLFGPVIRTQTDMFSLYRPVENSWQSRMGETAGIERAQWVLSQRFTTRRRPYITHQARTLSLPLLKEAATMFPNDFGSTTAVRFRADIDAPPSSE
jgi:hypothetical protein